MINNVRQSVLVIFFLAAFSAKSQSVKEIFSNSGIWADYGQPLSLKTYPEFEGRLVNINWADFEIAPGVWDWTIFDQDIVDHTIDSVPVIFLVYTDMNAPEWLFYNGVPKVKETDESGDSTGYSLYYLDEDYNFYFKRMITEVRKHVENLDPPLRNKIIGVQACFASTGDRMTYNGSVAQQYAISDDQFDSLFHVYSLYYYNEYKNVSPKITMLTSADYFRPDQYNWVMDNCPGGWIKCPSMAKGFQLNAELDKLDWLYDMINKPHYGQYIKSRCEIVGDNLTAGWWTKNKYKSMFAIMTYCIYWGLDWPNEFVDMIRDSKFDSAFRFFNKYAGQKVPALAQNAVCALKDVLDASDTDRFSEAAYGTLDRNNKTRYTNIYNSFASYGAKLEDPSVITLGEFDELYKAKGTNDVGWRLLPGNYERYLHQVDANTTSAGYWNVDDINPDAMYGRFARGFDLAKGKDGLYFDVEDAFLKNAPLNAAYPVTIEVTYYDNGNGSWQLYYDAQANSNKASVNVTCGNTKTWKKETIVLTDASFGNRSTRTSDFYIISTGSSNVMFSVVELSRPEQSAVGFITSPLASFDTVCLNAVTEPKTFVLNAAYLDRTNVQVGPLNGFLFSRNPDGPFRDSLINSRELDQINSTIYVKLNTDNTGVFDGDIPITGGGVMPAFVRAKGSVLNTSPELNAVVTNISCTYKSDGSIDLQTTGGIGPFTYEWSNSEQPFWDETTEDVADLRDADYTVTAQSYAGCSTTKTFSIIRPDLLVASINQDSAIRCKGSTTTIKVSATGGTIPYSGTGTFTVPAGWQTYIVTDARGCSDQQGYSVSTGTIPIPSTPFWVNGPASVKINQADIVYSVKSPDNSFKYIWTVPSDATITDGQNTPSITLTWGNSTGNVTVQAQNDCGTSEIYSKAITISGFSNAQLSSSTETENFSLENRQFMVTPNPAREIASLRFYAGSSFAYSVQVTDITGKILLIKKGTAAPGTNVENLDVHQLSGGYYFVTLINNKGEKQTLKLLKE